MEEKTTAAPGVQTLWIVLLTAALSWVVYTYRGLFAPLVISALLAYLLYPMVNLLSSRTGLGRRITVPLVFFGFLTLFAWGVILLAPLLVNQANLVLGQLDQVPSQLEDLQSWIDRETVLDISLDTLYEEAQSNLSQQLNLERMFRLIQGASSNIVWLIIIFITSFHLLRDWERLREWLFGFAPPSLEPDLRALHQEIKLVWQKYLRGQLVIMFILGVFSGIGAALAGIPGALLLGLLAGSLALIPSIGPAIATAIAALVAWTQGSSHAGLSNSAAALLVIGMFQGIQLIEGFWLTPRIMGRRLNLHPGFILIAIVGTLFTLGTLMALIIVPILASLGLIVQFVRDKKAPPVITS